MATESIETGFKSETDFYSLLNLSKDASIRDIEKQYRNISR